MRQYIGVPSRDPMSLTQNTTGSGLGAFYDELVGKLLHQLFVNLETVIPKATLIHALFHLILQIIPGIEGNNFISKCIIIPVEGRIRGSTLGSDLLARIIAI